MRSRRDSCKILSGNHQESPQCASRTALSRGVEPFYLRTKKTLYLKDGNKHCILPNNRAENRKRENKKIHIFRLVDTRIGEGDDD
jgi:hypothetical protein